MGSVAKMVSFEHSSRSKLLYKSRLYIKYIKDLCFCVQAYATYRENRGSLQDLNKTKSSGDSFVYKSRLYIKT